MSGTDSSAAVLGLVKFGERPTEQPNPRTAVFERGWKGSNPGVDCLFLISWDDASSYGAEPMHDSGLA
jgi:hypothetical protein